jgi:hypothetical protein
MWSLPDQNHQKVIREFNRRMIRAEVQGRHVPGCSDGRGEEERLDRHPHEERLEAHLRVAAIAAKDEGETEKGKW